MPNSTKYCTGCNQTKSLKSFAKNRAQKDSYCNWCKLCMNANAKRWGNTTAGKLSKRVTWLRRQYGLSLGDYDALLVQQSGLCAICQRPNPKPDRPFDVDHDHETGRVRGLLCHGCNIALGLFANLETLKSAINYLTDDVA